ncbi:MAG TPA: branched-chain amino acid ABC transporter substrate-binding protein [Burkholderiales bacterium]|jgi:branched-chain amino acid transport system substrate-binding protein|nr:branched-chain amino acid ABC transporter substrate-binding protein [Burkholderiales bacterium]
MRKPALAPVLAALLSCCPAAAMAAETVKIAHIDPLSGPFALVGESFGRQIDAAAAAINAQGGVQFEIVHMDNKSSPQETTLLVKQVVDSGIRYVTQGGGSNNAHALSEAVAKHSTRNPGSSVLYMNFAAQDPALTNEKCNFWHFRFDATVDMKVDALTSLIAARKNVKKMYLFNQDYAFGQAISKAAREMLARKRPDIEIVGDDLHPLAKVKDFSPYIAKIKSSGADGVITGNWGPDLSLLIKASKDAGLDVIYYTINAHNAGAPSSIGAAGAGHVTQVFTWHANIADNRIEKFASDFRRKYKDDFYYNTAKTQLDMLARAMADAKSTDPLKVARALENMKFQSDTGEVWMRGDDHQLMQPIYIATFTKKGGPVKYDAEGTGYGWKTDTRIEYKDTVLPTTCRMERPS